MLILLDLGCSFCIKRDLIEKYKKNINFDVPHDNLIWQLASIEKKAYLLNENLMLYRRHSSNASNNKENSLEKRVLSIEQQIKDITFLESICFNKKQKYFLNQQNQVFKERYNVVKNRNILKNLKLLLKIKYYYAFRLWSVDMYYIFKYRKS